MARCILSTTSSTPTQLQNMFIRTTYGAGGGASPREKCAGGVVDHVLVAATRRGKTVALGHCILPVAAPIAFHVAMQKTVTLRAEQVQDRLAEGEVAVEVVGSCWHPAALRICRAPKPGRFLTAQPG